MIPSVNSLEEAADWFLSHSSGSVLCINGDEERACNCYPDAKAFYEGKQRTDPHANSADATE